MAKKEKKIECDEQTSKGIYSCLLALIIRIESMRKVFLADFYLNSHIFQITFRIAALNTLNISKIHTES